MGRLYDVFQRIQECHQYTNISYGNSLLQKAWRCSEIIDAIRVFRQMHWSQHPNLDERSEIIAVGKDLVDMGLIRVMIPEETA